MSWAYRSERVTGRVRPARREVRRPVAVPGDTLSDLSRLAQEAGQGDDAARQLLMERVSVLVHRYCRARLGSTPGAAFTAEDAAQEACLNLMRLVDRYQVQDGPFEALVYTVASRRVADELRALHRLPVPVAEIPEVRSSDPGPQDVALRRVDAAILRHLLDRLTQTQREVLTLRVAVGLSTHETAAALGMAVGTVRVVQHRALTSLRRIANQEERGSALHG